MSERIKGNSYAEARNARNNLAKGRGVTALVSPKGQVPLKTNSLVSPKETSAGSSQRRESNSSAFSSKNEGNMLRAYTRETSEEIKKRREFQISQRSMRKPDEPKEGLVIIESQEIKERLKKPKNQDDFKEKEKVEVIETKHIQYKDICEEDLQLIAKKAKKEPKIVQKFSE